jgi:predicted phage-related endonuclease
LEIQ